MTFKVVLYSVDRGVATIRLNSPEYRNAQGWRMLDEIDAAFARAEESAIGRYDAYRH